MGLLASFKTLFGGGALHVDRRFETLGQANTGTMSKVYKVRDRKSGEVFALKILDSKKQAEFEARYKHLKKPPEGEIALSLHHPSIVETVEHGQTAAGETYLLMEYLDGGAMNVLIERSQIEDGQRLPLLRSTARAISAMHQAGYVHRDVCPHNVIVLTAGDTCKLIDFGLTIPVAPEFNVPGNRTGKLDYMAPELIKRLHTDQRLDVFAFGVTAFQLCAGRVPWDQNATKAMSSATRKSLDIRRLKPEINPELAEAIDTCLAQETKDRYATLEHFLHAIRDVESEFDG